MCSKTAWLRDRKLRRHEETHLRHIAMRGERRFWRWYRAFSFVGYWLSPFEIAARIAEGSPLDDPAAFNQRVTTLLKDATERLSASA